MDIIYDLFIDLYLDITLSFIHDKKLKKWQAFILKTFCVLVYLTLVAVTAVGFWFIEEAINKKLGITLISVSVIITIAHVVAYIILFIKKNKV